LSAAFDRSFLFWGSPSEIALAPCRHASRLEPEGPIFSRSGEAMSSSRGRLCWSTFPFLDLRRILRLRWLVFFFVIVGFLLWWFGLFLPGTWVVRLRRYGRMVFVPGIPLIRFGGKAVSPFP